ncbi:hypothetical protein LZ31DRAFT_308034 [Colletotrichum somersetense]|nr:hypothetical protein LZ31DRAFT_308034 [Colletotrichum somersetense]
MRHTSPIPPNSFSSPTSTALSSPRPSPLPLLSISLSIPFAHPPSRLNDSVFASIAFSTCARADSPFSDPAPTCLASLRLSPVELPVFALPIVDHRRPRPLIATSRIQLLPSHFRFHLGPVPCFCCSGLPPSCHAVFLVLMARCGPNIARCAPGCRPRLRELGLCV